MAYRLRNMGSVALALAAAAALAPQANAATLVAGWDFEKVEADGVSIKSVVGSVVGTIVNGAIQTPAGGGRPGAGGGKGFDVSQANPGWLQISDEAGAGDVLKKAGANDKMSVVLWQKNNSNINSSSFWAAADNQGRWFQFHIPWSDGTIYFDTQGCCAAPTQRLNKNVVGDRPDHDWTAWHHYAFIKDGGAKRIYIDGTLFHSQDDGATPLDLSGGSYRFTVGGADNASPPDAVIDDVAIFEGALTDKEIEALAKGGSPFAPPTDTDKDGIPDDWEKQYGFNPNDPADAKADPDKDGCDNLCEFLAGTDPVDTTAPTVGGASGSGSFDTVTITFSEELDATSATDVKNYAITPALKVNSATYKKKVVTLKTDAQTPGATKYTVTVNNVKDLSKNSVAKDSTATFYSYLNVKSGILKFSYWGGISGNPVQNLLDDPRYPATPDLVAPVFSFNSRDAFPDDSHEAYGATIEGYLTPAETGSYRFFIYSDDASQLLLSSDDKPANLAQIAEETGCCNFFTEPDSPRTSEPIALTAGKKYYIQMIYKEGGGGDYGQVAWRKEGDKTPAGSLRPIPSQFLSSAVDLPAPPQGAFTVQSPGPNAKGVLPNTAITIGHRDGATAWTDKNVTLKLNGTAVTPTFTKVGNVLTMTYTPPSFLASKSVQTVTVGYLDAGGNPASTEWSFTVAAWAGPTKDKVAGYPGLILNAAAYTDDKGGHTAKAGDYAINLSKSGGPVATFDAGFLAAANAATAKDEFTVAFWQKKLDTADSSAFTLHSPTAGNNRLFHAHVPWSNLHIYFDTTGCCDGTTQRIEAGIDTFADYTGDAKYFTDNWHLFVFTKKADQKNIWIDGKLFLNGSSSNPLQSDAIAFYMGSGAGAGEISHAIIDDFSVYGKELVEADVKSLFTGTLPTALSNKGLIAYWDFNDKSTAPAGVSNLKAGADGAKVKITFDGAGTIQSADKVTGPYTDTTIKSGDSVDAAGAAKFYRGKP